MTIEPGYVMSVVVPVFRNRASLPDLTDRLRGLASQMRASGRGECEVIFVDDGSDDESHAFLQGIAKNMDCAVELIQLTRNFGQVSAIRAGLGVAKGSCAAFVSADLQDAPELLLEMYDSWRNGAEIVIAQRVSRDDGRTRTLSSRVAYGIARRGNPAIPEGGFDFALMDLRVVKEILALPGRHRFLQGDILWFGYRTALIPYQRLDRTHGKSQWTWSKRWKYFIDIVMDGSYIPIQFISRVGVVVALLGLIYAGAIVVTWLLGQAPFTGWAPIMVTILIVGGLIMTMLGVVGEYLWRIYDDLGGRPRYVVAQRDSFNPHTE